jgi:hypothetical protein
MTQEESRILKDHIVRLYYERYTVVQIAELTALTYQHVRGSLIERGITPRMRRVCGGTSAPAHVGIGPRKA